MDLGFAGPVGSSQEDGQHMANNMSLGNQSDHFLLAKGK